MDSLYESFKITNNQWVNTFIIMNLAPLIISYMKWLLDVIAYIIKGFYEIFIEYIRNKLKQYLVGEVVLTLYFNTKDPLCDFLRTEIFNNNVKSEYDNKSTKLYVLLKMLKIDKITSAAPVNVGEVTKKSAYTSYNKRVKNKVVVMTNYSITNEKNDILAFESAGYNYDNKITKYFTHENIIYKITEMTITVKEITNREYKATIITSKRNNINKKTAIAKFEKFLIDKFNLDQKIYLKTSIKLNSYNLTGVLKSLTNSYYNFSNTYDDNLVSTENNFVINSLSSQFTDPNIEYNDVFLVSNQSQNDYYAKLFSWAPNELEFDRGSNINSSLNVSSKVYIKMDNCLMMIHFNPFKDNSHIYIMKKKSILKENDIKNILNELLKNAISINNNKVKTLKDKSIQIYRYEPSNGGQRTWNGYKATPRTSDTIYLPQKIRNDLRKEFDNFIENENYYQSCQIPYKKGILLYGPPGTGKSSVVKNMAYEYGLDVYIIDINDNYINDETIVNILNSMSGTKKILLFEDIDTAFADKEQLNFSLKVDTANNNYSIDNEKLSEKDNGKIKSKNDKTDSNKNINKNDSNQKSNNQNNIKFLTYSGLLNALDGILSNQTGVITVMTTNYIERLGTALIRPGRIDCKFELKECNDEQIKMMLNTLIKKKYNNTIDLYKIQKDIEIFTNRFIDKHGQSMLKPCSLQFYILRHIGNLEELFNSYEELFE